jgi:fatty-acyl-CoA synthase/long-chain acyl-CoA synthetase
VDRAKDMIITGGLNVYSVEVEAAIREHPAVVDVGVVGVPHADWGEAVVAVVVAREHVEVETLMKFARERISSYKVPKRIVFLDALPLTRYGKPDKKVIRSVLTR